MATSVRHLVKITVSASKIIRWTDAQKNIRFDSNWWDSHNIQLGSAGSSISGGSQSMKMTVDNVDLKFSQMALVTDLRGCAISVWNVALDKNLVVQGASAEADLANLAYFVGEIDAIDIDQGVANVTCVTEGVKARRQVPGGTYSATCEYPFPPTVDRPWCGYAGAEDWCDHSWARCAALANTDNFGGVAEMAECATKQFSWGKKMAGWRGR